jgi:hypothetical protein
MGRMALHVFGLDTAASRETSRIRLAFSGVYEFRTSLWHRRGWLTMLITYAKKRFFNCIVADERHQ